MGKSKTINSRFKLKPKKTMNQKITVKETNNTNIAWEFKVEISENESVTTHEVTMEKSFYKDLQTNESPKEIVRKSFKFLLERESKEMILSEFNISIISKYFPEYKRILMTKLLG
jgi:hypothetical protein